MVYLKAGIHVLGQKELDSDMITILDHGPIYRLAFLRELGPEITNSQIYKEWWRSLLNQWIAILDVIIWLDAPNPILLKRIRSREQKHSIKEECVQEAFKFLTHYRKFLKQIITDSLNNNRITMLHFDTNQISIEHMADKILGVFGPSFK